MQYLAWSEFQIPVSVRSRVLNFVCSYIYDMVVKHLIFPSFRDFDELKAAGYKRSMPFHSRTFKISQLVPVVPNPVSISELRDHADALGRHSTFQGLPESCLLL
jgi:hypothetical protein